MPSELKKVKQIDPKNAVDVSMVLEHEIATGELKPGTRLEEVSLGRRFGISRTPIREALRLLAASGLVEIRPNRGAIVSAPSLNELLEMFEAMAEMEAMCARLAARRMTEEEHEALVNQHKRCEEAAKVGDSDQYYRENVKFHALIYTGTHNHYLSDQVRNLRRRLQVYRRLQLRLPGRMDDSYQEHSKIVKAILNRDQQAAAEAVHAHVTVQGDRFSDWIAHLRTSRVISAEG